MTDDTRRHWHGSSGDRHEHHNAWVAGGAKGPAGRAPWALTPEMMNNLNTRRDSAGSASSNTSANANAINPTEAQAPNPPTVSERRRSSAGSTGNGGTLFSNLQSQKRESGGADMAGRRASWNEQSAQGGVFSKLWQGYTRGN